MNVVKTIKRTALAASVGGSMLATRAFGAASDTAQNGVTSINPNPAGANLQTSIQSIINLLIVVIGIVAVIMLIVGGFRYVFSQGNEKSVQGAKDTILFAIIGIVVALLAFGIVNFVLSQVRT